MAEVEYEYSWKSGSSFSRTSSDARTIGHELERLGLEAGANDGESSIQPQAVVDAARDERSVLHRFFNWDDTSAAEAHRRQQARQLVGALVVTARSDRGPIIVRAFVSLRSVDEEGERSYQPVAQAMSEQSKRALILGEALESLNRWKREYAALSEFSKIFAQIDLITTRLGGATKPKRKRRAA